MVVQKDSQEYEIDLNNVEGFNAGKSTLMIRNIPNKYTQDLMLERIDRNFQGHYDFFYLPIDFKNKCNVGYAFINFLQVNSIKPFYQEFNNTKWERFNSEKICVINYARIQGRDALIKHFQNSSVMNQNDVKLKPLLSTNLSTIHELVYKQKANNATKLAESNNNNNHGPFIPNITGQPIIHNFHPPQKVFSIDIEKEK